MRTVAVAHVLGGGGDYQTGGACQSDVHVGVRCNSVSFLALRKSLISVFGLFPVLLIKHTLAHIPLLPF